MRTTIAVLAMTGVLVTAGCAGDAEDSIDEVDPGLEATIDAPAENAPTVVEED